MIPLTRFKTTLNNNMSYTNYTINRYIDLGVLPEKIVYTTTPVLCIWSLTRKCLVGGYGQPPAEELIHSNKNYRVSYENNRMVSLQLYADLDVNKINQSDGNDTILLFS